MYSVCICCFIGLPAAGKTQFSNYLLAASRDNTVDFGVICINFDNYIKVSNQEYKKSRDTLLNAVESLITKLKGNSSFNIYEIEILNYKNYFLTNNKQILIILDDNHYFKSMRYKVIQLCRRYELGYFQIYFQVDLNTAKSRNQQREAPIPNEIIEKMSCQLEPPSLLEKIITIKADDASLCIISKIVQEQLTSPQMLVKSIKKHAVNPSTIHHQIDIILRKEITYRITIDKVCSNNVKILAELLNCRRRNVLQDIKSGVLEIPCNILDVKYYMD